MKYDFLYFTKTIAVAPTPISQIRYCVGRGGEGERAGYDSVCI